MGETPSQVGEIWVRGSTVFSGYSGLPEASAEAFAPGGWFRTGDLATASSDGYLSVVDRKKDMLLVGGENVYTTEASRQSRLGWAGRASAAGHALRASILQSGS